MTGSLNNTSLVEKFKQEMMEAFEMTDLSLMTFFLGMEIVQDEHEVYLSEEICQGDSKEV